MRWIYLSPHFDDAVLSCGGMIWEQAQAGDAVEIWTMCAGSPPRGSDLPDFAAQLHAEWRAGSRPMARRRAEDRAACARVGAAQRCWRMQDCIYRRLPDGQALIRSGADLWLPVHPGELDLVERLRGWLRRNLPQEAAVVCPLSLGNHVDHRIVRAAAEGLRRPLHYYADYPYVAQKALWPPVGLLDDRLYHIEVTRDGLRAWGEGVAAYASQISSLFPSLEEMHAQLEAFWRGGGGSRLWKVE